MVAKAKAKTPVTDDQVIDAALALAVEHGWSGFDMGDVAVAAKMPLADAYARFPSKASVLSRFMRRVDTQVLQATGRLSDRESASDRLFEVLMARFDALAPHKAAVRAIVKGAPGDLGAVVCAMPQLRRSFQWMLTAADLRPHGVRGELTTKAVLGVWLNAVRVWLKDDDPDLSKTMAALDRGLKRLTSIGCFGRRPGGDRTAAEAA